MTENNTYLTDSHSRGVTRLMDVILLISLLLLSFFPPFIFNGMIYQTEHFRAPKEIFNALCILIAIGSFTWLFLEGSIAPLRHKKLALVSFGFICWNAITLVTIRSASTSIDYIINLILYGSFFFIILQSTSTRSRYHLLLKGIHCSIYITMGYGYLQLYSLDPLFKPLRSDWTGHMLITGMLGNPNFFSALVALEAPFLLHWFITRKRHVDRIPLAFAFILLLYLIIKSNTLTALMGLFCGCLVYSILFLWHSLSPLQRHRLIIGMILIGILCFAMSVRVLTSDRLFSIVLDTIGKSDSLRHRIFIFQNTWRMFLQKPIMGWGIGMFKVNYYDFQVAAMMRDPSVYRGKLYDIPYQTHNDYLQVLAETGVVGLLLLLAVIVLYLRSSIKNIDLIPDRTVFSHASACLASVTVMLFNALANFPFHLAALTSATFFIAAGPLLESPNETSQKNSSIRKPRISNLGKRRLAQLLIWIPIAFGCARTLNYYTYLVKYNTGIEAFKARDSRAAQNILNETLALRPERGEVLYHLGLVMGTLGNYAKAEDYFREVTNSYRDYKIHTAYALTLEARGKIPEAMTEHEKAVFFNPIADNTMSRYFEFCLRNLPNLPIERLNPLIALCKHTLPICPNEYVLANLCGELLYSLKRYDEAEHFFVYALQKQKGYAIAHYNLGKLYQKTNRTKEAIQAYASASFLDPALLFIHTEKEKERIRKISRMVEGYTDQAIEIFTPLEPPDDTFLKSAP